MIKQNCKHNFQINIHYGIKYSVAAFAKSCPKPNYSSLNCSLKTQNQTRGLLYNIAAHAHNKIEGWIHRGLGSLFLLPALHATRPAVKNTLCSQGRALNLCWIPAAPPGDCPSCQAAVMLPALLPSAPPLGILCEG